MVPARVLGFLLGGHSAYINGPTILIIAASCTLYLYVLFFFFFDGEPAWARWGPTHIIPPIARQVGRVWIIRLSPGGRRGQSRE